MSFNEFNNKIDSFKNHSHYQWLRQYADETICNFDNFATRLKQIEAEDFIERIIAMPLSYIRDWLDNKNQLEWREQDKRYFKALQGNYLELQKQNPNMEIHKIQPNNKNYYISYLGYSCLEEHKQYILVGKASSI